VYHLAGLTTPDPEKIPNIVMIGLPDQAALRRVIEKLRANQIVHYQWSEPDNDWGLTAIATVAIYGHKREVLKNYRLWNDRGGVGQKPGAGFNADPSTNLAVKDREQGTIGQQERQQARKEHESANFHEFGVSAQCVHEHTD